MLPLFPILTKIFLFSCLDLVTKFDCLFRYLREDNLIIKNYLFKRNKQYINPKNFLFNTRDFTILFELTNL